MSLQNNCHNRPEFPDTTLMQDGWVQRVVANPNNPSQLVLTRIPNMVNVPFNMTKMKDGCHQWGPDGAIHKGLLLTEGCEECKWKPELIDHAD